MSGNPFRKQQHDDGEQSGAADGSKSKGKVKKVQFVSPIASPQEPPSHPRFPSLEELDDGLKSPPPRGLADDPEAVDTKALLRGDLTAGGAIDLQANAQEEAAAAARATARQIPTTFKLAQPPPGRNGPPPNPFSRTLETMEQGAGSSAGDEETSKSKSQMDVDAFKRLLLTGKPGTSTEEQSQNRENGSSTDSSFASKRSRSDLNREAPPESPASPPSSLEDASSEDEASSESDSDNERAHSSTKEPISQHSGPQTVSFDDFDEAILEPAHIEGDKAAIPPSAPRSTRIGSDSAKIPPVPPSPRSAHATPVAAETDTLPKKGIVPPPPPTSRRQGQNKTASRSRSSSNVEPSSGTPDTERDDIPLPNRPKPPPPRAPAPRAAGKDSKRTIEMSDSRSVSSDTLPTQQTPDENEASGSAKSRPPPPPSRNTAKGGQLPLKRATSSSSSVTPRRASPAVAGGAPPPPPPPRRGEGKRSSIDGNSLSGLGPSTDSRRSSGHSFGVDRKDSLSSLQRATEEDETDPDQTPKLGGDMLADLDAFQKEVDALRHRALSGA